MLLTVSPTEVMVLAERHRYSMFSLEGNSMNVRIQKSMLIREIGTSLQSSMSQILCSFTRNAIDGLM